MNIIKKEVEGRTYTLFENFNEQHLQEHEERKETEQNTELSHGC